MRTVTILATWLVVLIPCAAPAQDARPGLAGVTATIAPLRDSIPAAVSAVASQGGVRANLMEWSATRKGAVVGLGAGVAAGLVLASALCEQACPGSVVFLGAVGAGIGAGVGWLIDNGYQFGGTPHWPARRGAAPRVAIRWRF